jgi:hypothetical protein
MQVSFIQIPSNPVMYTLWKWRLKIANRVFQQTQISITATLKSSGILLAPESGEMSRRIKESVGLELEVVLTDLKGTEIFHDHVSRAGLEVIEGIFGIVKIKPGNQIPESGSGIDVVS